MVTQGQLPLRAAMLMLFSTLSFGMMAITIRYASTQIPTTEIAFFRNAFGLLVLLPIDTWPRQAATTYSTWATLHSTLNARADINAVQLLGH